MTADWPHGTGVRVHQPQLLGGRGRLIGEPAQRGLHQRRETPQPQVVLALAQQPGDRRPISLGAIRSQRRSSSNRSNTCATAMHVSSASVTAGLLARPPPGQSARGNDAVVQFHVKCGQESVQVGDHGWAP